MTVVRVNWSSGACVISDDHPKAMHGLFLRWMMHVLRIDGAEALFRLKQDVLDEGPLWLKLSDGPTTRDLIAWCYSLEGIEVQETDEDASKESDERGLEDGAQRNG